MDISASCQIFWQGQVVGESCLRSQPGIWPSLQTALTLALGTSTLDCVYQIALPELCAAIEEFAKKGQTEQYRDLATLVNGKRVRDIADFPLDLTI